MIIYKCTNKINGKFYIGKTKGTLSARISQHKSETKYENILKTSPFHNALAKYGFENFDWEVIDTARTEEELNQNEIFWIKELQSLVQFCKGYNINIGGNGGDNFTNNPRKEEIKKLVGEGVKKSRRWSEERRKQASINFKKNNPMKLHPENSFFITNNPMKLEKYKKRGKDNPMSNPEIKLKHLKACQSLEHRQKLSENCRKSLIGKSKTLRHRVALARSKTKVYWAQYDLQTKRLVQIFESTFETGKGDILNNPSPIHWSKKHRIIGNYIWTYYKKDEIVKEEIPELFREGL